MSEGRAHFVFNLFKKVVMKYRTPRQIGVHNGNVRHKCVFNVCLQQSVAIWNFASFNYF